jgi:hypothetical protein
MKHNPAIAVQMKQLKLDNAGVLAVTVEFHDVGGETEATILGTLGRIVREQDIISHFITGFPSFCLFLFCCYSLF